jgi:hypothetical protein
MILTENENHALHYLSKKSFGQRYPHVPRTGKDNNKAICADGNKSKINRMFIQIKQSIYMVHVAHGCNAQRASLIGGGNS